MLVRVIGEFSVFCDDRLLVRTDIGSRKARVLLALLCVDRRHHSPGRIAEVLWSSPAPVRPAQNVATMVSRLRQVLGVDSIVGGPGGYRLGAGVRVDLDEAASFTFGAPAQAFVAARRALRLLDRGGILDGLPDSEWADPARARHATLQREARHHLARAALLLGDVHTARTTAEDALATDRWDEVACRQLMRAYHAAGEPSRAVGVFHRIRASLDVDLGVCPSAPTQELYVAILRN